MLFGDSFSECREHLLTGMLAETFREVHFIWNPNIDYEYVNFIQPDVVITELAERFMTRVPADKLDIQSFAAERLANYKVKAINGDPSMGFALPESVILEKVILPSETYHLDPPHVVQSDCVNVDNDPEMKTHPIKLIDVENAKCSSMVVDAWCVRQVAKLCSVTASVTTTAMSCRGNNTGKFKVPSCYSGIRWEHIATTTGCSTCYPN